MTGLVRIFLWAVCSVAIVLGSSTTSKIFAGDLFDPQAYCEENPCRRGVSLGDPAILNVDWIPFESTDPLIWGADACLGYFLTKDPAAWNGGVKNEEVDDIYGIYLSLGDQSARIHIFDWPFNVAESPYAGFGVFQCRNTSWPERLLKDTNRSEILSWIEVRLPESDGWVGSLENWEAWRVGTFRNDTFGMTINVNNFSGHITIEFRADYFGPPVVMK